VALQALPIVDLSGEPLAAAQVFGGVAVAPGAACGEGEQHQGAQQDGGRQGVGGAEAFGRRSEHLEGLAIPDRAVVDHQLRRPGQGGPVHEELQGEQGIGMVFGELQGPLLGVHVGEVVEPLEVGAQVGDREALGEEIPALLLGLVAAMRAAAPSSSARPGSPRAEATLGIRVSNWLKPLAAISSSTCSARARSNTASRRPVLQALDSKMPLASLRKPTSCCKAVELKRAG